MGWVTLVLGRVGTVLRPAWLGLGRAFPFLDSDKQAQTSLGGFAKPDKTDVISPATLKPFDTRVIDNRRHRRYAAVFSPSLLSSSRMGSEYKTPSGL